MGIMQGIRSDRYSSISFREEDWTYKVKRKAMIRNWYNQIPHPALKTKREITKYTNWRQFIGKSLAVNRMNSSFPNRWSFSYLKFTKYVTNIIVEPKYKYGQQEQVIVRNHSRSTALEQVCCFFSTGRFGKYQAVNIYLQHPVYFHYTWCDLESTVP